MFNARIGIAWVSRFAGLMLFAVLLSLISAPTPVFATPKYISNYDVRRHLREDCREIVRKAKFYISARCAFTLIAVDRGGPVAPPGFSRRPQPVDGSGLPSGSSESALAGEDPTREDNYSPSYDVDLVRREQRIAANRKRAQALATDDSTPRKGRYSHMRALVRAKGFIRDVTFEVVWRLKWTPSNLYTRKVLAVKPARSPSLQSPAEATTQPSASDKRPRSSSSPTN